MDLLQKVQLQKAGELIHSASRHEPEINSGIGLSDREIRSYSILTAIQKKYDSILRHTHFFDGIEAEAHRTLAAKLGEPTSAGTILIPPEILRRDLTVGVFSAGGSLVGTKNVSFIEVLRNRTLAFKLGAQLLSGQTQQVTIPKQSGAATGYWLSTEGTATTESQQTFGQVALTPKTVGAYTEISRQLLKQSNPAAESLVMADLAGVLGVAVDAGVLNGSGTEQPTGIIQTSGIGTVSGTSLAYAGLVEFQQDIADANAMLNSDTLGYVTTPAVAALLKGRQRFANTDTPLWRGSLHSGEIEGVPSYSTKQMPTAVLIYGDWSQVVIAEWGNLAIEIDPFADFKKGIIGVRGLWSVDVAIRHAESFSVAISIT